MFATVVEMVRVVEWFTEWLVRVAEWLMRMVDASSGVVYGVVGAGGGVVNVDTEWEMMCG